MLLPAPIPEGKKPQDDLKYVYLSTDEDGRECKATWHSRTVEIDYGEFKEKELTKEAAARSKCGDRHGLPERSLYATGVRSD